MFNGEIRRVKSRGMTKWQEMYSKSQFSLRMFGAVSCNNIFPSPIPMDFAVLSMPEMGLFSESNLRSFK